MGVMLRGESGGTFSRSMDLGVSWASITVGMSGADANFAVTDGAGFWLVGGENGKLRINYGDGASSWSNLSHFFGTTGSLRGAATNGSGAWIVFGRSSTAAVIMRTDNGWGTKLGTTVPGVTALVDYLAVESDGGSVWLLSSDQGLHRSADNGATWTTTTSPLSGGANVLRMATDGNGVWVVGGYAFGTTLPAARSTDNGLTWTALDFGAVPAGSTVNRITTNGHGTWILTANSGVLMYRSTDNGATWSAVTVEGAPPIAVVLDVACYGGTWVAIVSTGSPKQMYRSTDNGRTWAQSATGSYWSMLGHVKAHIDPYPAVAPDPDPGGGDPDPDPDPDPTQNDELEGAPVWIVGGMNGYLARSLDGINWSEIALVDPSRPVLAAASDNIGRWLVTDGPNLQRSIDNGVTWAQIDAGFGAHDVYAVASGGNGVWIAVGNAGKIRRSADNGQTWVPIDHGMSMLNSTALKSIATDRNGVWVITAGGYLLRSTNNGLTWTAQYYRSAGLYGWLGVATDRAGRWVVVGGDNVTLLSLDNGYSWQTRSTRFSDFSADRASAVATDRAGTWCTAWTSRSIQRAITVGGVVSDGYWSNDLALLDVYGVATDRSGMWIAVGDKNGVGQNALRSTNASGYEATWTPFEVTAGSPDLLFAAHGVLNLSPVIDPTPDDPPEPGPEPDPVYWFAAGDSGKLRRSADNGTTWSDCAAGFDVKNVLTVATNGAGVVIAGGTDGQVRRSTDNGGAWEAVDAGFATSSVMWLAGAESTWVAVGGDGKMKRSTDGGATWATVGAALGLLDDLTGVATDRAGTWLACDVFGEVLRSTNNGATWALVDVGPGVGALNAVASLGAGVWLVVGLNGTVRRSADNGLTWVEVDASGDLYFGVAGGPTAVVLVGWDGVALRSADRGLTWALVDSQMDAQWVHAVAASDDGRWLVGGQGGRMSISSNDGQSWGSAAGGFAPDRVNAIAYGGVVAYAVPDNAAEIDVTLDVVSSSGALNDWSALMAADAPDLYAARLEDPARVGEALNLRIGSWQSTVQLGRANFLQVVVPGAAGLMAAVTPRSNWDLVVYRQGAVVGEGDFEAEMARVTLGAVSYNAGARNATLTLSGYASNESYPDYGERAIRRVQTIATTAASMRVRAEIDWWLRPGMTARLPDGSTMAVRYINYYVGGNRAAMDIGSAVDG